MMERLTQTSNKGGVAFTFDLDITCKPSEAQKILRLAEKLKAYEDAEEQGLLLRLPFEVGTEIYVLTNCLHIKSGKTYFKIEKFTIRKYVYNSLKNFVIVGVKKYAGDVVEEHFFKEEIGKIVFEKYADAEAALKAKQEGE